MSAKQLDQVAQATKTAFVFPGQGSQKVGMLAELAEQFASVEATFAEASKAVGFDLWHIAQSGDGLDQTEFTSIVNCQHCFVACMVRTWWCCTKVFGGTLTW